MEIRIKYHADIGRMEKVEGNKSDWIDLRTAEDVDLMPNEFKMISLGVSMELPEGYEAIVAARSSTFKKWGIILTGGIGVIDGSYRGDNDVWMFPAFATRKVTIPKDTRIAQFRIFKNQPDIEFDEVVCLGNPDRGGIGSSGER